MTGKTFVPHGNQSPPKSGVGDGTIQKGQIHPNFYEGYYYGEVPSIVAVETEAIPRLAPPYCDPDFYHDPIFNKGPGVDASESPTLQPEQNDGLDPFPGWRNGDWVD